jgi:hypothetical protein
MMGYRSEVLIIIQMDDHEDEESIRNWHLFIAELKTDSKCDSAMRELMNGDKHDGLGTDNGIDMINCSLYVDFRETKWYDGYDLVDSYNHIVGKARQYYEDLDVGMSVCFIRVGEETTDVVEDCYGDMGHQLAYLSRPTIEIEDITFDPDNKLIN